MRRTLSATVLVLAFGCPVSAGVIHNPRPAPLLKSPVLLTANVSETHGAKTTTESGWSDSLTEITFDLLAVLPALL